MGWNGSLTANSTVGSKTTWEPNSPEKTSPKTNWVNASTYAGNYSVGTFTAPKRGIYRFVLKGSGGVTVVTDKTETSAREEGETGGEGGKTTGYLLLESGQTVYVGAGGVCRAAFVSSVKEDSLAEVAKSALYFVAGGGGSGGAYSDDNNRTGYNCKISTGGNGGGSSGSAGASIEGLSAGKGGTQSAGGAAGDDIDGSGESGAVGSFGTGGAGVRDASGEYIAYSGRGGDGYYGGSGGGAYCHDGGLYALGGGGGSGYVKTASLTVNGNAYPSTTAKSGGAAANNAGSVEITYYATADLHVYFNGTHLTEIYFNDERVTGLIYGSTRIFAEVVKRCLTFLAERFGSRAATPA